MLLSPDHGEYWYTEGETFKATKKLLGCMLCKFLQLTEEVFGILNEGGNYLNQWVKVVINKERNLFSRGATNRHNWSPRYMPTLYILGST